MDALIRVLVARWPRIVLVPLRSASADDSRRRACLLVQNGVGGCVLAVAWPVCCWLPVTTHLACSSPVHGPRRSLTSLGAARGGGGRGSTGSVLQYKHVSRCLIEGTGCRSQPARATHAGKLQHGGPGRVPWHLCPRTPTAETADGGRILRLAAVARCCRRPRHLRHLRRRLRDRLACLRLPLPLPSAVCAPRNR